MNLTSYYNSTLQELFEKFSQTELPEHKTELLNELRNAIKNIKGKSNEEIKNPVHISESLNEFNEQIRVKTNTDNCGYFKNLMGFTDFDKMFGGFPYRSLIVIGGRPNMGCDYLLLNIALFNAINRNNSVSYFSLDTSLHQLLVNISSIQSNIPISKINLGKLNDEDFKKLENCFNTFKKSPLFIDDSNGTVEDFRKKIVHTVKSNSSKLVLIDFLQSIKPDYRHRTKDHEISAVSKMLKEVAKEMDITIIVLSQLNRAVETRSGSKTPTLSDLRESGSIEQDADMVIFLYRPEVYGIVVDYDGTPTKDVAQLFVEKNKFGALGSIKLNFNSATGKFSEDFEFNFQSESERINELNNNKTPY